MTVIFYGQSCVLQAAVQIGRHKERVKVTLKDKLPVVVKRIRPQLLSPLFHKLGVAIRDRLNMKWRHICHGLDQSLSPAIQTKHANIELMF